MFVCSFFMARMEQKKSVESGFHKKKKKTLKCLILYHTHVVYKGRVADEL